MRRKVGLTLRLRKNWLFYGSDVHADAAAALFSLIASCRLHDVEPVPPPE